MRLKQNVIVTVVIVKLPPNPKFCTKFGDWFFCRDTDWVVHKEYKHYPRTSERKFSREIARNLMWFLLVCVRWAVKRARAVVSWETHHSFQRELYGRVVCVLSYKLSPNGFRVCWSLFCERIFFLILKCFFEVYELPKINKKV